MNNQRCALICDSGCDMPAEFVEKHGIRVIPLTLNYKSGSLQSGIDITTQEVIERFAEEIPTTSLPSPDTIKQTFEQAKADGYERALFVGISSGLSATNQTVELIAGMIEDFDIEVVDTKNIGIGAGLIATAAAEMLEENVPFNQLKHDLELLSANTYIYFVTKTLDYLHRGGRISDTAYALGSALNIKPIITCNTEGTYVTTKKSRGIEKAMRYETSMIRSRMEKFKRARVILCCANESDYVEMENLLREKMDNIERLEKAPISAALVVHTGPELIGVAAQPDWHDLLAQ